MTKTELIMLSLKRLAVLKKMPLLLSKQHYLLYRRLSKKARK